MFGARVLPFGFRSGTQKARKLNVAGPSIVAAAGYEPATIGLRGRNNFIPQYLLTRRSACSTSVSDSPWLPAVPRCLPECWYRFGTWAPPPSWPRSVTNPVSRCSVFDSGRIADCTASTPVTSPSGDNPVQVPPTPDFAQRSGETHLVPTRADRGQSAVQPAFGDGSPADQEIWHGHTSAAFSTVDLS
jgi:hypothetical protein